MLETFQLIVQFTLCFVGSQIFKMVFNLNLSQTFIVYMLYNPARLAATTVQHLHGVFYSIGDTICPFQVFVLVREMHRDASVLHLCWPPQRSGTPARCIGS